jgi:polysaccharide export outer membrane protein
MLKKRTSCLESHTARFGILLTIISFLVSLAVFPAVAAGGNIHDYAIGAGDVLSLKVYDHDELTVKVRVSEAGTIDFPLIGQVHVGGLGTRLAAERIETALANGYIIEPQVTIFVEQFKSKKVIVLGPVHNPGLVELNGSITLLELMSQVGGLKDNAGQTATIKRQENGTQRNISIDLDRLIRTGDPQQNIQIQGGDTVSIAEGAVCFVTGEVNQPGEYPCGRNVTVLKVVSQAGSFTEKALESGIKINRTINGSKRVLQNVSQDTLVQPDDVIVVPERTVSKEEEKLCFVSGEVTRPGAYPCSGNTTILKLLTRAGGFTDKALESGIEINRQINGRKQVLKTVNQDTLLVPEDVVVVPASAAKKEAVCYITGEVSQPGAYPCSRGTSILKLLTRAGGFTDKALESGIEINRQVNGGKRVLKAVSKDTLLLPEDVVIVPASFAKKITKDAVCYISGEVSRPGAYPCSRGTSILKLLTRAGGFTDKALESGLEINRQVNGGKRVLKGVSKDTLLLPEDVVIVPASFAKKTAKEAVCYITGQVRKPGAYPCGRNATVLKLVSLAGSFTGIAAESSIEINRVVNGKKQVLEDVDLDTLLKPEDVIVVPESFF